MKSRLTPALVVVLAVCATAFAAGQTAPTNVLAPIVDALVLALGSAMTFAVAQGGRWLGGRISLIGNARIERALDTLNRLAWAKVYEIYQDAVEDIKVASQDGRLTLDEANAAFNAALKELTDALPGWLHKTLLAFAGGSVAQMQETYLSPAIEQAAASMPVTAPSALDEEDDPVEYQNLQARRADSYRRLGLPTARAQSAN